MRRSILSKYPYYYVTVGSNKSFLKKFTTNAIFSLLKTGVPVDSIHFIGKNSKDVSLIKKRINGAKINYHIVDEDISNVKWKYAKGKRKYSLLKAAALYKTFPDPLQGRKMVYFDGDVLWYKDPTSFLDTKSHKTWFHHGKVLAERTKSKKRPEEIDIKSLKSLREWCSEPMAYLMVKYGINRLPEKEVVAGFYVLHESDHSSLLKMTYEGCVENSTKFARHEGGGDQKPLNAALNILNIDWHGGCRFDCPEHKEYFDHFFGKDNMKNEFFRRAKKICGK